MVILRTMSSTTTELSELGSAWVRLLEKGLQADGWGQIVEAVDSYDKCVPHRHTHFMPGCRALPHCISCGVLLCPPCVSRGKWLAGNCRVHVVGAVHHSRLSSNIVANIDALNPDATLRVRGAAPVLRATWHYGPRRPCKLGLTRLRLRARRR